MKVKRLQLSPEVFLALFHEGDHHYAVVKNAIPADAELMNVRLGWPATVELILRSESFPEVPEGEEIPTFAPICETRHYERP